MATPVCDALKSRLFLGGRAPARPEPTPDACLKSINCDLSCDRRDAEEPRDTLRRFLNRWAELPLFPRPQFARYELT